jgi:adenine phosphoribosyltransferase
LQLLEKLGADVIGCSFVIDLPDLGGRQLLEGMGMEVHSLCAFAGD